MRERSDENRNRPACKDECGYAASVHRLAGVLAWLRRLLVWPITWWTREEEPSDPHQQSAWQRGKLDAIAAAKDGRLFGLASTGATCAAPTIIGLETAHLPTVARVLVVVGAAIGGYVAVPLFWAIVGAIRAPVRQRDEARRDIERLSGTTGDGSQSVTSIEVHAHGPTFVLPEGALDGDRLRLLESRLQAQTALPRQSELRPQEDHESQDSATSADDERDENA